jgi:4-diphosphocytidyl-2-C-methyl-D-erythritol kinase
MNAENIITVQAPAKINLTLEVLRKRSDGYHEIRSVIQTIDLCDTLTFEPSDTIEFRSDLPSWRGPKSMVAQAVKMLQEVSGCRNGARITVSKRIPLTSGLGGDSSDAAAVLRGIKALWHLPLPDVALLELASRLGSDVPFFLRGGTALMQGRGEIITPLPPLHGLWFVLVVPSVPRETGKTAMMYQSLKPPHYTDGRVTQQVIAMLPSITPDGLFNTFENIAFARGSELDTYRQHILKMGATNVHLAGSGPTLFSILDDRNQAEDLCGRLKHQNMECYLAQPLAEIEK